jgi:hypothetical protein
LQVQFAKAELPVGELEFDGQEKHVEVAEAPNDVEYVPAPQLVHKGAPVAVKYVPAPQSVHAADPVDALYFPATHAEQGPPAGPENPALQVQFVKEVLPANEVLAVQSTSAVQSTPHTMRSAIAEVASVLRYSSTTKTPAMSPLK